jgi:hypothetical protein
MLCNRLVRVDTDIALYEINHATSIMGNPVPKPKMIGKVQFHAVGSEMLISIIVKKYTNLCGQNAMAKNIPNMKDHNQLFWVSIL